MFKVARLKYVEVYIENIEDIGPDAPRPLTADAVAA